jgi:D-alanyl-lipoteichoic acid acyltransferase DltB (MBOAT superfamily)
MSWRAEYILLIIASTVLDYTVALRMERSDSPRTRKAWLGLSLTGNLGLLFFFKYFNFFNESVAATFKALGMSYAIPAATVLLPVGISFYTFQTLSYTIEVYRGNKAAERHIGKFALYVAFFPQLVAGPIERATSLLPQFSERKDFEYTRVTDGMKLMVWGFFKKVVIADRLATFVDPVYADLGNQSGPTVAIATIFFAYRIYCDFSGYSDIAIGAAQVLGFKLMTNFRQPYFSRSIPEFWRRWHISLSTWFRDYVYIPLGGSRVSVFRLYVNLAIVFLVSGLWHGANWTFLAWGGLHASYMIVSQLTVTQRKRFASITRINRIPALHSVLQWAITFSLVCFAWIFFCARSIGDAITAVTALPTGWNSNAFAILDGRVHIGTTSIASTELLIALVAIGVLEAAHVLQHWGSIRERINRQWLPVRWFIYSLSLWALFLFGTYDETEFIYFAF